MLGMEEIVPESEGIGENSKHTPNQVEGTAVQEVEAIQNLKLEPNQGLSKAYLADSDLASQTRAMCFSHTVSLEDVINTKKEKAQLPSEPNVTSTAQGDGKGLSNVANRNDKAFSENSSPLGPPPGFEFATSCNKGVPDSTNVTENPKQSLVNIEKLAKESIQIGNILGLKIIHNEKAAVERIIRTLRSNSKKYHQEQKQESKSKSQMAKRAA